MAQTVLAVSGMHCSFCAQTIERALGRMGGVEQVAVSLAHEEALVGYDPARVSPAELRGALRDLGYIVRDPHQVQTNAAREAEVAVERVRLAVAGVGVALSLWFMALMWTGRAFALMPWLMFAVAAEVIFVVGWPILRMAVASMRRGILNQHVLMELGAIGGLAGGVIGLWHPAFPSADFFAAATFIAGYHLLSGFVSLKVRTQTSQAVQRLMALQPATARVVRDGREQEVAVGQVRLGDLVRVRPGESIPVDGVVRQGGSAVSQALVTGEPIPVEKTIGDEVIGGSINQAGTLLVQVTRIGSESFLAQVVRYVEQARALKPGLLALVDRILKLYVPAVLVIAAAAFLFWTVGSWLLRGQADMARAAFAALAVGVMGYPCALGMATPLAMIRGGGMAAERGILMRSAAAFQLFGRIDRVVLDKTGTLTLARPQLIRRVPVPGATDTELLTYAAAVEAVSEHPLARAIVEAAESQGIDVPPVHDFVALPGRGVRASAGDTPVLVCSPDLAEAQGISLRRLADSIDELQAAAHTVVVVIAAGRPLGVLAIADPVKPDAAATVAELRRHGIEPVMLTGDNERTARAVAEQAGIGEVHAQVLPGDKAAHIRALQKAGHRVAMIGDGINDAPALTQADIGIAIGAGTDIAIDSADVILIGDRLSAVVDAYRIGRGSYRRTKQNLAIAFAFNGIGVPAASTGLVPPAWAMAAMAASVTLVLANSFGLRLFAPSSYRRFADPVRLREQHKHHGA